MDLMKLGNRRRLMKNLSEIKSSRRVLGIGIGKVCMGLAMVFG